MGWKSVLIIGLVIFILSTILLFMIVKSNFYDKEFEDEEQIEYLEEWIKKNK